MATSSSSRYSNAKHWCPLCKTFIQNDLKSIRNHEEGLRHLGVVKRRLNQAARVKDFAAGASTSTTSRYSSAQFSSSSTSATEKEPITVRDDEILGQYSVRGTVYFQGEYHEDLLTVSSSCCQLSLVDEEGNPGSWINCQVESYDVKEKAYVVRFKQDDDNATEETVHVAASDLRIIGPPQPSDASNWSQVENLNDGDGEDVVDNIEEVRASNDLPTVEYYKGVAIVEDDKVAEQMPPATEVKSSTNVVFRKRTRPSEKT